MMKETKNNERFTRKEWEELASILSDEKEENGDLLDRFMAEDQNNSGKTWKDLKNMSNKEEINIDKAWNKVHSRLTDNGLLTNEKAVSVYFNRITFFRIAAAILLLVGLGSAIIYMNQAGYFSQKITIIAGMDQKNIEVPMPDGSKVYLNRSSEFSFRKNFGKHGRNVKLKGEAFFEIARDAARPFVIDAGKASVKVVGTSFNVITDNRESAVEVFVRTGEVLVSDNTGDKSILLDPGYVGTVSANKAEKEINTNQNYMSWKTGHLEYSGQKLSVVFSDLKRVYNMDIVVNDPSILENPWHSPIDNSSQETIIRLICTSFNLSYTKDGDVYHLSKK